MNFPRRSSCVLALSVLLLGFGVSCPAQSLHLPPHEKLVLKNGLTVLLLEKPGVPLVNMFALVKTGAAADPQGESGLASVTATLLRKGTKSRTAQQFASDLDFIGGSFEADATADYSYVSAEFMTKDLARGLDLFSDALLHPVFPQVEVNKVLAQGVDAVKSAKDDPRSVVGLYYQGYLYGAAPYGRPAEGDEVSLKKIQRDAIVNFYQSNFTPRNMILAIAGEFDSSDLRKKLEEAFAAWPSSTVTVSAIPFTPPAKGKRLLLIDKPDATQTYFAFGNIGATVNDPDRVAIRVVNTIFGGRFTSELNEALRVESGYTYGAFSSFDSRRAPGPFEIMSFTKNQTTVPAIDLALQVLDKLHKDGVTPEQLASAKSYIKGQFAPTIETSNQLARRIALNEFYGLGDDEVNQLEDRLEAVTPEIARAVIAKHFPTDNLVFVLIGKASEIRPAVKKFAGQMDERSINDPGFWPPQAGAQN
ncbi:MAG TPA: pitrilysin family protein [Candidatus Acidoferrum sp.]|nr:pitrilysin family protein [Candidatus Acidoferrum sp.]